MHSSAPALAQLTAAGGSSPTPHGVCSWCGWVIVLLEPLPSAFGSSASSSCRRASGGVRQHRMEPAIEELCPAISGEDGSRWMESISNDEDAPQCRICFDGGCFGEQGPLFRPCRCSGSMAWVHRECLDQWRRSSANPRSFFRCDNCLFEYRFGRAFVAYDRCSTTVAVPLALAPAVPPTRALTRTLTLALAPPCRRCTPGSR